MYSIAAAAVLPGTSSNSAERHAQGGAAQTQHKSALLAQHQNKAYLNILCEQASQASLSDVTGTSSSD